MKISSALISVFNKKGLEPIVEILSKYGVTIYSTGGTLDFIKKMGITAVSVEETTGYPSIFGGRVKTLHPKVFGGILNRRDFTEDALEMDMHKIPQIDLVVVDLYPFEEAVSMGSSESEIIDKIDIGGMSLIRAAAKNFSSVFCLSSVLDYAEFIEIFDKGNGHTTLEERKRFAGKVFKISRNYESHIYNYFSNNDDPLSVVYQNALELRYGENPHQKGTFYGDFDLFFEKLNGKSLSYNNLLDVDSASNLISEFRDASPTFAIIKHTNACGLSTKPSLVEAYEDALSADPVSAFGGILACNAIVDLKTAEKIGDLFFEVILAPDYQEDALLLLKAKKNRIVLKQKMYGTTSKYQIRSCLSGVLCQTYDSVSDDRSIFRFVTEKKPTTLEENDLIFASKICKHAKSNAVVLAKNQKLLACGVGQTSRVDSLKQAIKKAKYFGFDLNGSVLASDAFFPFPDCVEIASEAGVTAIIQPGGSIRDALSVDCCNRFGISMVHTSVRHFKH